MQLHLAVIAHERHAGWLTEWIAHVGHRDDLVVHPVVRGVTAAPPPPESDVPIDATVILVNGDTVAWARGLVEELGAARRPIAFVTRSVKPLHLRGLLARGGHDFIPWDCHREELLLRLWKLGAESLVSRRACHAPAGPPPPRHPKLSSLIGTSPAFLEQLDRIPKFAACDAGVLVLGETGTGKELVAQAMH